MEYYLIQVFGSVDPKEIGPFESEEKRDERALELHNESDDFDLEEDGLFWADVDGGKLTVGSYSAGFFEGEKP